MKTDCKATIEIPECPGASVEIETRIRRAAEEMISFINTDTEDLKLIDFERSLWPQVTTMFQLCVALFLAVRHQRIELSEYTGNDWRVKDNFAQRTIKTMGGPVRYGRAYLTRRNGGGWFPLDAVLGITQDGFSLQVVGIVTRLATRLSYSATRNAVKSILGWAPSAEAIELLVIGMGQRAPAFMTTQGELDDDGEVLIIEVDGKAAPMATEAELGARRQKRKHAPNCSCGCQRHRGRQRRKGKKKKRKKRGHNSKNGRSATLVSMYTLHRGEDGKLHGPINKKIWGQFGERKNAIQWAREQATRRGFGPQTSKVIQIVVDGERCLRNQLEVRFPNATLTLDLRHAQEYLWKAGRLFHAEDSEELAAWVKPLNDLLLAGKASQLLIKLRKIQASIGRRGPNTKKRREGLRKIIAYYEPRQDMMRYDEYHRDDLVLATGVIEGACRYVIGERLDCSGMRWTLAGAEPLLQLRCIELNGDWSHLLTWISEQTTAELKQSELVMLRTPKPPSESSTTEKQAA